MSGDKADLNAPSRFASDDPGVSARRALERWLNAWRCSPMAGWGVSTPAGMGPIQRQPTPLPSPSTGKVGALTPCQVVDAPVPVRRARISPTVRSRPSGSGSGRCAWMW